MNADMADIVDTLARFALGTLILFMIFSCVMTAIFEIAGVPILIMAIWGAVCGTAFWSALGKHGPISEFPSLLQKGRPDNAE